MLRPVLRTGPASRFSLRPSSQLRIAFTATFSKHRLASKAPSTSAGHASRPLAPFQRGAIGTTFQRYASGDGSSITQARREDEKGHGQGKLPSNPEAVTETSDPVEGGGGMDQDTDMLGGIKSDLVRGLKDWQSRSPRALDQIRATSEES